MTIISTSVLNKKQFNTFKKRNKHIYEYEITIRLNTQGFSTAKVRLWANGDNDARVLAEMQYGRENVFSYFKINN